MTVPWLDEKTVEADADRIIPLLAGIIAFVPGGSAAAPVLAAIKVLVDNDTLRPELVDLLNRATGAVKPV
jgi:hypothetical protein